jgi:hypothetical protein
VSQARPHAPQLVVDESEVSHPLVFGAAASQSAQPGAQPTYVQVVPLQPASRLTCVSHTLPHAAQLSIVAVDSHTTGPESPESSLVLAPSAPPSSLVSETSSPRVVVSASTLGASRVMSAVAS